MFYYLQTCQPLRILRNNCAFRVSNTPLRKPVQNVGKLRILRNFGAIRPIPRNLQRLSWLAVSRKSPAGQNIDKDLFILRLPSASASDFAIGSTKEAAEVKPCPMKRRADREPFKRRWVQSRVVSGVTVQKIRMKTLLMSQSGIQFINTCIFMINATFEQRFCLQRAL